MPFELTDVTWIEQDYYTFFVASQIIYILKGRVM